jgi:mono/diheme cytochrome c family protein
MRALPSPTRALSRALRATLAGACAGAAALLLLALPQPVQAQDTARGMLLYTNPQVLGNRGCGNAACHGSLPAGAQNGIANGRDAARIKQSIEVQGQMAFLKGRLSDEDLNDIAAYIAQRLGGLPTLLPVAPRAQPRIEPEGFNFGVQAVAIAAPARSFSFSNASTAGAPLVLQSVGVTAGSDFSIVGGTCNPGLSLAAGASCTVAVSFRPTLAGTRSATLTLVHDAGSTTASLLGLGGDSSPVIALSPTQLTFAQTLGTASPPQRVLVSNSGSAPLVLEALTVDGNQAAEFAVAAASTCTPGLVVPAGSNCAVELSFTPAAAGPRGASLLLRHNAGNGSSRVALVGQGNAAPSPELTLDATRLELGTQALGRAGTPRTLTLGNSGQAELRFLGFNLRGLHASDMVLGGSCAVGQPVPPGERCTVTVALLASGLGTRSALLEIASNTATGQASVALQGDAIPLPAPAVVLSQAALGFGRVSLGTDSVPRLVTLGNDGSAPLDISELGSSSGQFIREHDCPARLEPGARCRISVVFRPTGGSAAERVVVVSNAFSSPNSVVLTGVGVAEMLPTLAWDSAAGTLDFGAVDSGQASAVQTLTLVNNGPGTATVSSLALVGRQPEFFSLAGGTCTPGSRLEAGGRCTLQLQFAPGAAGLAAASLIVASDGSNPPEVALAGVGSVPVVDGGGTPPGGGGGTPPGGGGGTPPGGGGGTPPGGGSVLSPFATDRAAIDFRGPTIHTGSRSAPISLRVSNRGATTATIRALSTSSGFVLQDSGSTDACRGVPWTLPPGSSCTVAVVFAPSVGGASSGSLRIEAEDGSTLVLALEGEATTVYTNVGAGRMAPGWALALALAVALLWMLDFRKVRR